MSTTPSHQEPADRAAASAPLFTSEDRSIRVWKRTTPGGVDVFNIKQYDKESKTPGIINCFADINGHELLADEAAALFQGFSVDATCVKRGTDDTYPAELFSKGIKSRPKVVNGQHYENLSMEVGVAVKLFSKNQRHTGYLIGGTSYRRFVESIELDSTDCYRLSKREPVERHGLRLSVEEVKETKGESGKIFKDAVISHEVINQEEYDAFLGNIKAEKNRREEEVNRQLQKTDDGLVIRTFFDNQDPDLIIGYRVTAGDKDDRESPIFRPLIGNSILSAEDAANLFRGKTVAFDGEELRMNGTTKNEGGRSFANVEVTKTADEQIDQGPRPKR